MKRIVIGLTVLASGVLNAQRASPRGRIEGEIVDSVHSRPLAGATVMLARLTPEPAASFSAVTDARGRFQFDALAAGQYSVAFTTASFDSLDIMLPPRQLTIADGETARVDMVTPSGNTLRDAACHGVPLPPGQGAVVGEVTDADSGRPIPDARVVVAWTELALDRTTLKATGTPRSGFSTTDSSGLYRLCGVPTNTRLIVELQTDRATGAEIAVYVDDATGVARRPLSLSTAEARTVVDAAGDSAPLPLSGTAMLGGTVRALDGRPLASAHVRVVDAGPGTVTDSAGHFELSHLPAGSQVVEARKLGYTLGSAQVELRRGVSADLTIRLTRYISLDSVHVIAQRVRYRDFEANRRHSMAGSFLTEEQVTRRAAFITADLMRTIPGVIVMDDPTDRLNPKLISSRIPIATPRPGLRGCYMNIVIDGAQNMELSMINPRDIGALEVYVNPISVPIQYAPGSPCGAVVIWTKRL